ncbi:N-6 DNA methylase [Streptomyces sp. NPDC005483]|uniref:N-6 DNA methylase n=1 Tax=Streptomyces sp. NPDC005483 TaxID=3154882 RepID=UPI0033A43591
MIDKELAGIFVSRPDIARLAGVKRPAVSNWERRYPDYPTPAPRAEESPEPEVFRADEVLAWLSTRTVPANALRPGEPVGTTYGDRFRAGLTGRKAGGLLAAVRELTGPAAERMRGPMPLRRYLNWLLHHVFVAVVTPDGGAQDRTAWDGLEQNPDLVFREETYPRGLTTALQELLDRNPPGSAEEGRQAFDLVHTRLRDAEAQEGGDFLTPPSVSRVMAGALHAVTPPGAVPLDPYCRTGELLTAYLDTVATHGGNRTGRGRVLGGVLHERARRIAYMNILVHGGDGKGLGDGPVTPALSQHYRGGFDAVITNPPFGGKIPGDLSPPDYWTYGPSRRTEFDWLQYVVSLLAPEGRAAVLMPAGAAFQEGATRNIREGLIADGVVECVMALPRQLFELTAIQTHIWFLRAPRGSAHDVLFVDGEHLGHSVTRTRQALSDHDIAALVQEFVSYDRAGAQSAGLSRAVPPGEIAAQHHRLDPALYVRPTGLATTAADPADTLVRLARIAQDVEELHIRARAADDAVAEHLRRYGL